MDNYEMFNRMLTLQDELNSKINLDWKELNRPWYRAAWIECAELASSLEWKWWKKEIADISNARMELVDIFHFVMSHAIVYYNGDNDMISDYYNSIYESSFNNYNPNKELDFTKIFIDLEQLILHLIEDNFSFYMKHFFNLMNRLNMNLEDLFKMYLAKNILNIFRQDHGYKLGTYIKIWDVDGNEDNYYLHEFLDHRIKNKSNPDEDIVQVTYEYLENIYSKL